MATKRNDAVKHVIALNEAQAKTLRQIIEHAIANWVGGAINVTPVGRQEVIHLVANEYRDAGWTVTFGNDQRDGAWMTLQ